eukprot:323283_1
MEVSQSFVFQGETLSIPPGSLRPSSPATIKRARTFSPPTTARSRWFRRGLERVRSVKQRVLTQIGQSKKDESRLFKEVIKTPKSSRVSPKSEPSRRTSSRKASRESSRSGSSACSIDLATNARFFDGGAATVEELPKFRKSSSAPTCAKPYNIEAGEGAGSPGGPGIHTDAMPGSVGDSVEMLMMDGGVKTDEKAVWPVIGKVIVSIHELRTDAQRRPYLRCTLEDRLYKVYVDRHKPEHGPIVLEFSLIDITADLYIELCGAHNLRPDTRFAGQVVFPVISLPTTFGVQEGGHCAWHATFNFLSWLILLSQLSAWPFVLLLTVAFFGVYTRCARTYGDIHAFRDEKDTSRNARERIEKVTEAMTQVQGMTGSVATVAEKFANVASGGIFCAMRVLNGTIILIKICFLKKKKKKKKKKKFVKDPIRKAK